MRCENTSNKRLFKSFTVWKVWTMHYISTLLYPTFNVIWLLGRSIHKILQREERSQQNEICLKHLTKNLGKFSLSKPQAILHLLRYLIGLPNAVCANTGRFVHAARSKLCRNSQAAQGKQRDNQCYLRHN